MMTAWLHGPMFRLNIVIMSSLAFLAYGFNPPSGEIEVLQLPVAGLQVYFILAVLMQNGLHGFIAPLTKLQRGLIAALIGYMIIVSAVSPVPSAHVLVISWVIHVLFFVALISFFEDVNPDQAEVVWLALGVTALIHVAAFLMAGAIWPQEIGRMNLLAFGHIRHLSYLLAPAAAAMAVLLITRRNNAFFPLVCYSAAVFYILYTGSRGGAAAMIAGLTVVAVYLALHRQRIAVTRIFILLGITAILLLASEILPAIPGWPPVFGRGVDAIDQAGSGVLTGRDAFWRFAWLSFERNWIWGYGPVLLSDLPDFHDQPFANDNLFFHPHNVGLQLLLHWGALGTVLMLAIASSFAANVFRALSDYSNTALMSLAVVVTMAGHALADGGLFYPFTIGVFIMAIALMEAIGRKKGSP